MPLFHQKIDMALNSYSILHKTVYALSLLPFGVLYVLSDIGAFILYHIVRYRRHVVRKNLVNSFPEKTLKEIIRIEKGFYRYFCDYVMETVKLMSISETAMRKRMRFENTEIIEKAFEENRSVAFYLGHYCNWEWISTLPLHLRNADVCGQIYHPLHNATFDRLMLEIRGRFHAVSIPTSDILRKLVTWHKQGLNNIVGYISDQIPKMENVHHWMEFLHQDTAVFTGGERLSKAMHDIVIYGNVRRESRGHYVCRFEYISHDASLEPPYKITESYFRMLEKTINDAPQYWLWSHNRWKRTRREFDERYSGEKRERQLHHI